MNSISISKSLKNQKSQILGYMRHRSSESLELVRRTFSETQFKERAGAINKAVNETGENLLKGILQKAKKENWKNDEILPCILMITYCYYVTMIEARNDVWPYEYMTFSRRIGELWEPFCKIPFDYPTKEIEYFVPPLFSEIKAQLTKEIDDYIDTLNISTKQKDELRRYYHKVWSLVTSGEIKLELDLHFTDGNSKYNVDFKSGFGSNEKGNTNRLLMVATIYKNLEQNFKNIILVRSNEEANNHYYQTLKNSGVWEGYCGAAAYEKIAEFVGFDLKDWVQNNINWQKDFKEDTYEHFQNNNLTQYLQW